METTHTEDQWLDPVARLGRDLRVAAATLSDAEARFLVDAFYMMQDDRKRARNQERALGEASEPHLVINWLAEQSRVLETQILVALDRYTSQHKIGDWMRGVYGIGPVLSAGLLANIYMGHWCAVCRGHTEDECRERQADKKRKLAAHEWQPVVSCPTAGTIWAFAGIAGSDQRPWERGTKRPWNARLKTLAWKIGDCFVKFSNNEQCAYGKLYRQRKEIEVARNEAGVFAPIAAERIERDKERKRRSAEAPYHDAGKLSPGHVDLRARRWAVKIFLSHLHQEWFRRQFGTEPPAPFPIAILGHAHMIPPPH
jgi:hypothetical protein